MGSGRTSRGPFLLAWLLVASGQFRCDLRGPSPISSALTVVDDPLAALTEGHRRESARDKIRKCVVHPHRRLPVPLIHRLDYPDPVRRPLHTRVPLPGDSVADLVLAVLPHRDYGG